MLSFAGLLCDHLLIFWGGMRIDLRCFILVAAINALPNFGLLSPKQRTAKRVTCGGNYGWFEEKPWEGKPCPPPMWEPVWELNRSTTPWTPWGPEISEGNIPGFVAPKNASRWGWVNFDWSDANAIWQNEFPHMNEQVLVEQCRLVKAEGTGTKCMVYRNTELALQWQESSRAAMTAANVKAGWFLRFKTQALCDAAAPCNVAAYHNILNQSAPLVPCNKTAPISAPNCAYCCNFSRAYNEPIGGPWPPAPGSNSTRFGNNALGDGQFFWDFRNTDAQDYFAETVCLKGMMHDAVDGTFTDDPGGFGQEHPAVQSMVQLTDEEISSLQLGTQHAWMKALTLLTKAKKYIPQAYRTTPPFVFNTTAAGVASCTAWMRAQCAVRGNESTQVYPQVGAGPMSTARVYIAAFLVSRGPFSYLGAPYALINRGDWTDPLFRLHRLDSGVPTGECTESGTGGVFTRTWSGGTAKVDCNMATATLDFKMLNENELERDDASRF